MKTLVYTLVLVCAVPLAVQAQMLPKTSDINEDVHPDGSIDLGFQMTFDAAPWRQWKATVGDEPARLRAMMRHQFAVMTLDDFKLDRDDMNRVAKMSMRSPVGPELRDDGSYQVPVDGYFRLVNGAGRNWFFSGNNPSEGNALNNVKVTLPANAANAYVANPNSVDQALIFALVPAPSPLRWFYYAGTAVAGAGLLALLGGILLRRERLEVLPPAPRHLPERTVSVERPPIITAPPANAAPGMPPPIPPSFSEAPRRGKAPANRDGDGFEAPG